MKLIICCFLFYIENLLNLRLSVYFFRQKESSYPTAKLLTFFGIKMQD